MLFSSAWSNPLDRILSEFSLSLSLGGKDYSGLVDDDARDFDWSSLGCSCRSCRIPVGFHRSVFSPCPRLLGFAFRLSWQINSNSFGMLSGFLRDSFRILLRYFGDSFVFFLLDFRILSKLF